MLLTFIASTNSAANPSATNTPTQISSVFDCFISITEHKSRQHEIEAKHGERRVHNGAGGRAAHTLGRRHGIIPFIYRDPRGDETAHRALDDTVHHVLVQIHARLHLRPEGAVVHAQQAHADEIAAHHTDRAEDRREQLSGMEMMAVDPLKRVIAPRFVAGTLAMPLLAAIFSAIGVMGGYFVGVGLMGGDDGAFWSQMQARVELFKDVMNGVIKSAVFGFVASWIAVYEGYDAVPTSEGVSRATTRTVVHTALAVLGLDFVLTALMFGD